MRAGALTLGSWWGVAPRRRRMRAFAPVALFAGACLAVLPAALAFEGHTINVRMSLGAPLALSGDTFTLAADAAGHGAFEVGLTPAFTGQERLDEVEYRLLATLEPADAAARATAAAPEVVLVRDPAEPDAVADGPARAFLSLSPADTSDRWTVVLWPAAAPAAAPDAPAAPSADASVPPSVDVTASVGTTAIPPARVLVPTDTPAPAGGSAPATPGAWVVHLRVEAVGYRRASPEVE